MPSRQPQSRPKSFKIANIIGTHERRLEFDGAVKEIMRQRKVAANMQIVARQQKSGIEKDSQDGKEDGET